MLWKRPLLQSPFRVTFSRTLCLGLQQARFGSPGPCFVTFDPNSTAKGEVDAIASGADRETQHRLPCGANFKIRFRSWIERTRHRNGTERQSRRWTTAIPVVPRCETRGSSEVGSPAGGKGNASECSPPSASL